MTWQPSIGAWPEGEGVRFRVWAPEARSLEVVLHGQAGDSVHPLAKGPDGYFSGLVPGARAGDRYRYRIDGRGPFPDPASRFQPEGVHGPSEVIDPRTFSWTDGTWRNLPREDLVVYELHVGTFTPEGTFKGVEERLADLTQLGVNAIELMPVGDFSGNCNWGYDGVDLFAPARCYGRPDDLRRLVDTAHRHGLAVLLDVVYNHLGPDGNYTGVYSPYYTSGRHRTPWGDALNLDDDHSRPVRDFFIENALHWAHDYHIDGLRLDATHAMYDDSQRHFLAELADRVRTSLPEKPVHLIAEDHRNLAKMVLPEKEGGWGLDGVWADDFHHQMRRLLAGDSEGYYRDYTGSATDLAATIRQGWFYTGQFSEHLEHERGTDPSAVPPRSFVVCLQNHDQVGNRAFGERLNQQIDLADYRAASMLLLCTPGTPLLFMGQEWAASSPFLFFTDHHSDLGRRVTQGRRREFRHFSAFTDPKVRETIPDPQALATFEASRLDWSERQRPPHDGVLRLYQELLRLRHTEPALQATGRDSYAVTAAGESAVALLRKAPDRSSLLVLCQMRQGGRIAPGDLALPQKEASWQLILSTEDSSFCPDPHPVGAALTSGSGSLEFGRPGAVILRGNPAQ
jgi:maltooligosyltrehalose trehalohydrolase